MLKACDFIRNEIKIISAIDALIVFAENFPNIYF